MNVEYVGKNINLYLYKKIIFHEFHLLLVSREGRAEGLLLIKPYLFEAISCPVLAKELRWKNTENIGKVSGTSSKNPRLFFMYVLPSHFQQTQTDI